MSGGNNKIQYYDDIDYIFLILKLLDYPEMKRNKFTFCEIRTEKYKYATISNIFDEIAIFKKQGLLEIKGLKFDLSYVNKNDYEDIQILKREMIKNPKHKILLAMRKIMKNDFNLNDLVLTSSFINADCIFNSVDFDIKINKKFKQKHTKWLKGYLKLFANGKLESKTKNYPRVETQKENIKEKINKISTRFGSVLVLKESDFNSEYRFFECILLLEKEKFLIIKDISSEKIERNLSNYLIHCKLKKKNNPCPPFCVVEKNMGFLRFGKNGKMKKISKTSSQPFRLLQLLLESFGVGIDIEFVFEEIETERVKKYPDSELNDQMRKVGYVAKELQRRDRLGGLLKITTDKNTNKIKIDYK